MISVFDALPSDPPEPPTEEWGYYRVCWVDFDNAQGINVMRGLDPLHAMRRCGQIFRRIAYVKWAKKIDAPE